MSPDAGVVAGADVERADLGAGPDVDVVVVGAGPAGSAAAWDLARRGHRVVVLERWAFPREKACGDGLTEASMTHLADLGLGRELSRYQGVHGTRVTLDAGVRLTSSRSVQTGRVVPRSALDATLSGRAAQMGADVRHGVRVTGTVLDGDRVAGVTYEQGGASGRLTSRFVVAADGATSLLARRAGLTRPTDRVGFAVRAYVDGADDVGEEFEVFVPLRDPVSGRTLPGYGWVFPLGSGAANVGVGVLRTRPDHAHVNLRTLFDRFVGDLRERRPGMRGLTVRGPLRGAPLPCEFDPARCAAPGLVLVGDAARLVDPLSGEGIDTALASGAMAAAAIDRALHDGAPDVSGYGDDLRAAFGQRIAAAWALVENHEFVWGVVSETADVERPLYRGVRAAIRAYDRPVAAPQPVPGAVDRWLAARGLGGQVATVERSVHEMADDDLPMLAGALEEVRDARGARLRVALLLTSAGAGTAPSWRVDEARRLAVATELACLALAAHEDVLDPAPDRTAPTRSANRFAVSAGDSLLFRCYGLAADVGQSCVHLMARASADVCVGTLLRSTDVTRGADHVAARQLELDLTRGTLVELPVLLGAELAGLTRVAAARLGAVGRALGVLGAAASSISRDGSTAADSRVVHESEWSQAQRSLRLACASLGDTPVAAAVRALAEAYRDDLIAGVSVSGACSDG